MTFVKQKDSIESQDLSLILRRKFPIKIAIEIKQYLVIDPIAPNKIGVGFVKDIKLNNDQKETLRECLHYVYGTNVAIVTSAIKPKAQAKEQTIVQFQTSNPGTSDKLQIKAIEIEIEDKYKDLMQWQKAKKHLIYVYGIDAVSALFSKLDISETDNQITFTGSDTFTDMAEQKFGANLGWLAKEYGLHFIFKGKNRAFDEFVVSEIRDK